MSKYFNKKVIIDGIKFDSKKEAQFYLYLKQMQIAGNIKDLKLQVEIELQPSFKLKGKTIRSISYVADFTFYDDLGAYHVVDVKSEFTRKNPVYKIKKKLLLYKYKDIIFDEEVL